MWEWDGKRCPYCGDMGCRRRICRTVGAFRDQRGFNNTGGFYGQSYPLWCIVKYLEAMVSKYGQTATEFGKRYPHRRAP